MNVRVVIAVGLVVAIALLAVAATVKRPADWWLTADQQGDRLMAQGDFSDAADRYDDPTRRGVAYYRDGRFEEAASDFARVDDALSAYNRGNALIMLGKYDDAILSFDRALQFEPQWEAAQENRAVAVARRDKLKPPADDAGGTGGQLGADEIVFDDRAKNASQSEEVEVGAGEQLGDESLRELWLQRVQTKPADFLRVKFSYQLTRRERNESDE